MLGTEFTGFTTDLLARYPRKTPSEPVDGVAFRNVRGKPL
jgi:hypothetical protein